MRHGRDGSIPQLCDSQISVLSALSGFLLILAFPKSNLEILAWIAFVPWLWALKKKSPFQAAYLGLVAGLVFFTGLLYWIYVVLTEYGHLPGAVSIFFLIVLTAYLSLYFSAFAFLLRWAAEKPTFRKPSSPLPFGYPWNISGASSFPVSPGGSWGIPSS